MDIDTSNTDIDVPPPPRLARQDTVRRASMFEPTPLRRMESRTPDYTLTDEEEMFDAATTEERQRTVWSWTHLTQFDSPVPMPRLERQVASGAGSPGSPPPPPILRRQNAEVPIYRETARPSIDSEMLEMRIQMNLMRQQIGLLTQRLQKIETDK